MPALSPNGDESLLRRLILFAVGGAFAGFVSAPFFMLVELATHAPDWPLLDFLDFWSPLDKNLWHFLASRIDGIAGAPVAGLLLGMLIGVCARWKRSYTRMVQVTLCTGSLYASLFLFSVAFNNDVKALFYVAPVAFIAGAAFGGATVFFAGVADRMLGRIYPASSAVVT
jgi:hypothetical protein